MRKLLLCLSTVSLLVSVAPSVSAGPGAGAGAGQDAFATWIDLHGDTGDFHGAFVERFVDPEGGLITGAAVFKGKCRVDRTRHMTIISCSGRGQGKEIPFEDFQMDPALGSASLRLRAAGYSNSVKWTGRGPAPVAYLGAVTNGTYAEAGVGMSRDAAASGKVYGKRMRSRGWLDWSQLGQGAGAAGWYDLSGAGYEVDLAADGSFSVTQKFVLEN